MILAIEYVFSKIKNSEITTPMVAVPIQIRNEMPSGKVFKANESKKALEKPKRV
jgi:hypothetical protein